MDYIKHKDKSLPIRYDHTAIRQIMTKFELKRFQDIDTLEIQTNMFAQPEILKIGLNRGAKFSGVLKEYTDEEVDDILDNVTGIVETMLKIFKKDIQSVYTVVEDDVISKVAEAKKKKA